MDSLANLPCADRTALSSTDQETLLKELSEDWRVEDGRLIAEYSFGNYLGGISFVNLLAGIAEKLNHHPELIVGYRRVKVILYTHTIGGLSKCDFVFAARVDKARSLM
ncbi:MAG: 4a-hydroxytetrahydrobiopterin dehydratase [Methanobacteriota archaeon]|nr:MAG: 4a-hydroxytetrahydrobiopterin dehydratase [Euryarchaeota archaeon]